MQEDLIPALPDASRTLRFIERWLDAIVRPSIGGWRAFHVFGLAGVLGGIAHMSVLLAIRDPRLLLSLPALVLAAIAAFLLSAVVESYFARREQLTCYHHLAAVFVTVPLVCRAIDLPLLRCLDTFALGVGTTLAFCRLGCTMAGCCHGRPHRWGVLYGIAHVERGFPAALAHTRLFPIQLVEAFVVMLIVATGSAMFVQQAPDGAVLAHFFLSYAMARMAIEEGRGDAKRKRLGRFSEAQWWSFTVCAIVLAAERAHVLPATQWHLAAAVLSSAVVVALSLRPSPWTAARHLFELAMIVHRTAGHEGEREIVATRTSEGYRITGDAIVDAEEPATLYAISREGRPLSDQSARSFASLFQLLRHRGEAAEIVRGASATHVVFRRPRLRDAEEGRSGTWSIPPTHPPQPRSVATFPHLGRGRR